MADNFWTSVFGWSSGKTDKLMELISRRQQQFWGVKKPVWVDTDNPIHLYLTIPELRSVINRRALMMAGAMPKLIDADGNEVENHAWVYDLIAKPNPTQS